MQKTKRGVGEKRCVRVSCSMTNETHKKLKRLAVACDLPPATLLAIILESSVNSPAFVNALQDKYNKNPQYRVVPMTHYDSKKITY